jgi:hypothetical protein
MIALLHGVVALFGDGEEEEGVEIDGADVFLVGSFDLLFRNGFDAAFVRFENVAVHVDVDRLQLIPYQTPQRHESERHSSKSRDQARAGSG